MTGLTDKLKRLPRQRADRSSSLDFHKFPINLTLFQNSLTKLHSKHGESGRRPCLSCSSAGRGGAPSGSRNKECCAPHPNPPGDTLTCDHEGGDLILNTGHMDVTVPLTRLRVRAEPQWKEYTGARGDRTDQLGRGVAAQRIDKWGGIPGQQHGVRGVCCWF